MMKSITLITQDFYPMKGGIASYLMQLYKKYFTNQQFQVIVPNSIGQEKEYQNLPFHVFRLNFFPFELNTPSRNETNNNMLDILNQTKTDVVLFGYLRSHPEVGLLYKKQNPDSKFSIITHAKEAYIDNCIVDENHSETGAHKGYLRFEAPLYKSIIQDADYVFCVSEFTKRLLSSQGIKRKFHILHPPIEIKEIKDQTKCKIELGYDKNDFILLSVGRLINRKGQHKVINSIYNLQQRIPGIKYAIVGNGPNKVRILRSISKLNLENKVKIFDSVDDDSLLKFYGATDIFVLPTDYIPPNDVEGFGIVFIEANMHKIPVIGGDTGGVTDAIINAKTGYLINPHSSDQLETKILKMYSDPELRAKIGHNGRKRAIKEFNNFPSDYLVKLFS